MASRAFTSTVQVLIEKGVIVNAQTKYGHSALWAASLKGHLDIVQVLIEKGANVNAPGKYGDTVLQVALRRGRSDIVQLLRIRVQSDCTVEHRVTLNIVGCKVLKEGSKPPE
ncbi:ankyrin repeat-containing domain protein [Mycena olivaceomarginata]|nr:ankyrin repeat-containing domain protein [Mycena olivaceomarginata]